MTDKKRIQKYVPRRRLPASKNRWKKPRAFRVHKVINWTALIVLFAEAGQLITPIILSMREWTEFELIWLFWSALSAASALGLKLFDLRDEICCPDDEANDPF